MFLDLVRKNRSYRRFDESYEIGKETLVQLIQLARLSPSGGNIQPLKYYLSCNKEHNSRIFPCLRWAKYLKGWPGPVEGEQPTAYIVVLGDTAITGDFYYDPGIVSQTILLGAAEMGMGGCMLGNIHRTKLREELGIDKKLEILLVIALGKPVEDVVIDDVGKDGNIKYWRDENRVHHVPKRNIEDLVINI